MVRKPKFSFGTQKKLISKRFSKGTADKIDLARKFAIEGFAGIDTKIFNERFRDQQLRGITKAEIRAAREDLVNTFGKEAREEIQRNQARMERSSGSAALVKRQRAISAAGKKLVLLLLVVQLSLVQLFQRILLKQ